MKPIIYNSYDMGAPQLDTNITGGLRTILKACLVTGYGDKDPAGWEIVWEDNTSQQMSLRSTNATSLKCVLHIDDNYLRYTIVKAFNSWDSMNNTGIDLFKDGFFNKDFNLGLKEPNWIIVATDKFFYLFIQTEKDKPNMRVMYGFGDSKSIRQDSRYAICMCSKYQYYAQDNTGYSSITTQLKQEAIFPQHLYEKEYAPSTWGSRVSDNKYVSIVVLSEFVLYVEREQKKEPSFQLYGMLMPHAPFLPKEYPNNIGMIKNQYPYKNPILGLYQPWNGEVWIHTDDWGE